MDKISKIESLTFEEVIKFFSKLLVKLDYQNVEIINPTQMTAIRSNGLMAESYLFMFYEGKLSGNVETQSLVELIKKVFTHKYSKVFIISNKYISTGIKDKVNINNVEWIGRDELISLVDEKYNEFWRHGDSNLIEYEKFYLTELHEDSDLKTLRIFSDKYKKLNDIYIDPKIEFYDQDTTKKKFIKIKKTLNDIVSEHEPLIITGEAGMGKSTLLKKIGEKLILENDNIETRIIPVYISTLELFEAGLNVEKVVIEKINFFFKFDKLDNFLENYKLLILIDSIDEFEDPQKESIINYLKAVNEKKKVRYIIASRSKEFTIGNTSLNEVKSYNISRFDNKQIVHFVQKFFLNEGGRAEKLLDALKDNRIIEKLPISPLTLSLITILYEENNLEVPATITDIYDNFNSVMLGKPFVSSRVEFIDLSFRERILSIYALELLNRPQNNPMKTEEFINFFTHYFKNKTIPLKKGTLEEMLEYLINHTGILYLKEKRYVCFNHNSFMEYYASIEIFKHKRVEETKYVDNFLDVNWQNSAIFYAGFSKDMPDFLRSINSKLQEKIEYNNLFSAIGGAGYLIQALYQTDNQIRKETVKISLENNLKIIELFLIMVGQDSSLFKQFKLPIIWLMNVVYFHENFNSVTLKEPLQIVFDELFDELTNSQKISTNLGYKALCIALVLNSKRLGETVPLEKLIYESDFLEDSILTIISDYSITVLNEGHLDKLKLEIRNSLNKVKSPLKYLLETPANKLKFTDYDVLFSEKKVTLLTEGKTDAKIIEHAYIVLNDGAFPEWKIKIGSSKETGGTGELSKTLASCSSTLSDESIVIGIFDNDEAGFGAYNGLKDFIFLDELKVGYVKKHKDYNIYAILLPIISIRRNYFLEEQKFKYLEIEHFFSDELLKSKGMFENTSISASHNIFKIKSNKKEKFAEEIIKITDRSTFENFDELFSLLDSVISYSIKLMEEERD